MAEYSTKAPTIPCVAERSCRIDVAVLNGQVQRRPIKPILSTNIDSLVGKKSRHHGSTSMQSDKVQRSKTDVISRVNVDSLVSKKERHRVSVSAKGRGVQRSLLILLSRVNVDSLVGKKERHYGSVSTRCSEMQRRYPTVVDASARVDALVGKKELHDGGVTAGRRNFQRRFLVDITIRIDWRDTEQDFHNCRVVPCGRLQEHFVETNRRVLAYRVEKENNVILARPYTKHDGGVAAIRRVLQRRFSVDATIRINLSDTERDFRHRMA